MASFYLTVKATEDLASIWDYTFENWSENQADKYYSMLLKKFQEIANNPNAGKKYDSILTNLLGLRVSKHIIFYRKIEFRKIEITRILHVRMDLENRLLA